MAHFIGMYKKADGHSYYKQKGYDSRELEQYARAEKLRTKTIEMYEYWIKPNAQKIREGEFGFKRTYAGVLIARMWFTSVKSNDDKTKRICFSDNINTSGELGSPLFGEYEIVGNTYVVKSFFIGGTDIVHWGLSKDTLEYKGVLKNGNVVIPKSMIGKDGKTSIYTRNKKWKKELDHKKVYAKLMKLVMKRKF